NPTPQSAQFRFCPEGVGAQLARDLARSGSMFQQRGGSETAQSSGFTAASQQIASKLRCYGLRPESKASVYGFCVCPEGAGLTVSGQNQRPETLSGYRVSDDSRDFAVSLKFDGYEL
ncbi:hypothetical protein, partial [Pseudomonas sp.]|uniref:hypothetical protein n=1 Tax=Pseudomonas sp. TaxID=306 RepID=UPI0028AFF871